MNFQNILTRPTSHRLPCISLVVVLLGTIFVPGCQRSESRLTAAKLDDPASAAGESRDHLILALDFLDSFHRYDPNEMIPRIVNHLQTWIADADPADDWIADPLFGRLPQRLNLAKNVAALFAAANSESGCLHAARGHVVERNRRADMSTGT